MYLHKQATLAKYTDRDRQQCRFPLVRWRLPLNASHFLEAADWRRLAPFLHRCLALDCFSGKLQALASYWLLLAF